MRRLALFVVVVALAVRCPTRARCGRDWYMNGVRPDGRYECRQVLGAPEQDLEDARARRDLPEGCVVRGQIHCTGTSRPILVDGRTAACQPGGWP